MKSLTAAFIILIGGILISHATESINVSPAQADTWLAATPAVQVLDVRTREEFADGHLVKATLIPWTDKDFTVRAAKELDPRKPVLVYCRSGRRSTEAAAALVKLGFTEVRNLAGGILAWQQAGKPVHKSAPTPKRSQQALPDTIKVRLDIPYADTSIAAQRLDLYLPAKPMSDKPLPVIVFIHGGAWQAGNKASGRGSVP